MSEQQSLKAEEKQELQAREEATVPGRHYVPATDIYETDEALFVVMEIPGVARNDVDIHLENNELLVEARIDPGNYENYKPVYTEYNVGNFSRSFRLSSKIDTSGIDAKVNDGVLTLRLPKAAEAKPRKIQVG